MPATGLHTNLVAHLDVPSRTEADVQNVEQILREVLTLAISCPATSAQEVLLDFNLGASRFVLLRFPLSAASKPVLSPREQEIVRMVSQGHPNKMIADVLNISCWTVSTHVRRIFSKLGVTSRAAMVARLHELPGGDESSSEEPVQSRPVMVRSTQNGQAVVAPADLTSLES